MAVRKRSVSLAVQTIAKWTRWPESDLAQVAKRLVENGHLPKSQGRKVSEIHELDFGVLFLAVAAAHSGREAPRIIDAYRNLPLLDDDFCLPFDVAIDLFRYPYTAPELQGDEVHQRVVSAVDGSRIIVFRDIPRVVVVKDGQKIDFRDGQTELRGKHGFERAHLTFEFPGNLLILAQDEVFDEQFGWVDPDLRERMRRVAEKSGQKLEPEINGGWSGAPTKDVVILEKSSQPDADRRRPPLPKVDEVPITATLDDGSTIELERYPRENWEAMSAQEQEMMRGALLRKHKRGQK